MTAVDARRKTMEIGARPGEGAVPRRALVEGSQPPVDSGVGRVHLNSTVFVTAHELFHALVFKFGVSKFPDEERLADEEAGQITWELQGGRRLTPGPINRLEPFPSEPPAVRKRRLGTPIPPAIPTPRGIEGPGRRHSAGQGSGKSLGLQ